MDRTVFAESASLPPFRMRQLQEAYYRQFITSWDELTTWPKRLREDLIRDVPFSRLTPVKAVTSKDNDTVKTLFQRASGDMIEAVCMLHADGRSTVCVSSMVGCPVGCAFCATGRMGFTANLTADEIIDQVLYFERMLKKDAREVTNVVFMGMGEPLLNLKEVERAITILTDEAYMGLGARRITISTSGYAPQLTKLIDDGYRGHIAISLHAATQPLRESLMPSAKRFPLPALMQAVDYVVKETGRRVSYEYILIDGVNDSPKHAKDLAALLSGRLAHVNLIPCNPVPGLPFRRSSHEHIHAFTEILDRARIAYTLRVTMGDDIKAACGQLAGQCS